MQTYENLQAMNGEFYIEARRLGHAVRWRGKMGGWTLEQEVYYVSAMYATPRGDSVEACQRWCAERGIELAG